MKKVISILTSILLAISFITIFSSYNEVLNYPITANAVSYNPNAAVAYAEKYWHNYNSNYPNYNGPNSGDCANFVSQCLFAGGLEMTDGWYFYNNSNRSPSWTFCSNMYEYFKNSGYKIIENPSNSQVIKGNPVLYWIDGNWNHAAICVGNNNSGVPVVAAHNADCYGTYWTMGYSRTCTILINDGSNETFFDFWGIDNNITISGTYKFWLKQVGLGDRTNSDVNLCLDKDGLGTIYQDDNGFYSYELDTTQFANGPHTIYAVFRNATDEIWVSRDLIFQNEKFFDFWGVDNNITISGTYKIWLKQVGLGNRTNSDVNICFDRKQDGIGTIYQDDNGFYSYELDTTRFANGQHIIYAVFRNATDEIWISREVYINNPIKGDANNDGELTVADAVMLQKWLLSSNEELTCWQNVDLCEDGKIDVFDMIILRRILLENNKTE